MAEPMIWIDGAVRPADGAVSALDRGLTLADGAFETVATQDGAARDWPAHRARLSAGLEILGIPPPAALDRIDAILAALAEAQNLAGAAAARITVSRGPGLRGLAPPQTPTPTMIVALGPPPPPAHAPPRLIVYRDAPRAASVFTRFKYLGGYGPNMLAVAAAKARGADDAILCAPNGRLACASVANLYVVDADGGTATPPLDDGALPGVTRARLIAAGLATEKSLVEDDLDGGMVLLSNSLIGVRRAVMADRPAATPTAAQAAAMAAMLDAVALA